jgi:predicted  nucleic acid-binding Zn-ribbon protein
MRVLMHEILRGLVDLQAIDSRIAALRAEMAELPKKLDAVAARLEEARARVAVAEAKLAAAEHDRREQEGELQLENEKLSKYRKQLYQIKTNKEYEAMLHEIAGVEKRIGAFEENVLAAMEGADQAKALLAQTRAQADEVRKACAEEEAGLRARLAEVEAAAAAGEADRARLAGGLDAESLRRYEQVRTRRAGLAVVEARQGSCLGCRMTLPPQLYNEIFKDEILTCPSCQRILYVAPKPEGAPEP